MTYIIQTTSSSPDLIKFYTNAQPVYSADWVFQSGILHFDYSTPNITLDDPTGLCTIAVDAWTLPVGDYDINLRWKITYSQEPISQANYISNTNINPTRYTGTGTVTSLSSGRFRANRSGNVNVLDISADFLCRVSNSNASIKFTSHPFTSSTGGSNMSSTNEYIVNAKRYPLNTF